MKEPIVSDVHPELHHYTSWDGLEGIVKSGSIFATHYQDLNDLSEIDNLKSYLICGARNKLKPYLLKNEKIDRDLARYIRGKRLPLFKLSRKLAEWAVNSLYEVTFQGFKGPPFAIPFITSFCTHSLEEEEYERENGLLSQWRGYGGGETYALVFDSKGLESFLTDESEAYQYKTCTFFDVIYDPETEDYHELFDELEEEVRRISIEMAMERPPDLGEVYYKFVHLASRLKHRGFREEQEVRIVANLQTREMDDYLRTEAPDEYVSRTKPFKKILTNKVSRKRYITLFDSSRRLPIKRIIVGPHRDKTENAEKVRNLVGQSIEVHVSKTPYIG